MGIASQKDTNNIAVGNLLLFVRTLEGGGRAVSVKSFFGGVL